MVCFRRIGDKMLKSIRNQNKNKKHAKRLLSREEYLERKKLAKTLGGGVLDKKKNLEL